MIRARASVALPAAKGTTMVSGLAGHAWARADALSESAVSDVMALRRVIDMLSFMPHLGDGNMLQHGKRPTIASRHGMVAAAHPLAAAAGARMLANGGNAFDAAAATAATLNVVEPYMSGLAGQGYATCYVASERRVRSLNFVARIPRHFPLDRLAAASRSCAGRSPSARRATSPAGASWCAATARRSCPSCSPRRSGSRATASA